MQVVATEQAPRAIGPYSQAIAVGDYVFTAGQIALDPASMQMVDGGIVEQTDQVLKNLAAVLQSAGTNLSRVVKTTVFLVDMADFPAMNEVYQKHFGTHKPARSTVAVAQLPRNGRVEIEAVATKR
jgi:2-iminobutanoate/2-iminopropanoate deaminase